MLHSLQRYREPALTALVIVEGLWLFVLAPLTQLRYVPIAINVLSTVVIVAIVLVICSGSRAAEITIITATVVDILAQALHGVSRSGLTITFDLGARIAFFAALTWVVGTAVFGPGRVTIHRIQGAIAIELTIAMTFATFYRGLDLMTASHAFRHFASTTPLAGQGFGMYVYFSFTTLTSTGYGDVVPIHPFARSAANLEALIGQLFPATLLARLVSLEIEARRSGG
ncbi:MAG TPA: potassium channel family protein [Candidatus Elarobacter sp.]|jgi:hypothetical protein|nr:potassium channel family protein [Candidatus Elarobacter sp.]